jgi:hypothetical protein
MEGGEKILDAATTPVVVAPRENYATPKITYRSAELTQIYVEELEAILNGAKSADRGLSDAKARGDRILSQ